MRASRITLAWLVKLSIFKWGTFWKTLWSISLIDSKCALNSSKLTSCLNAQLFIRLVLIMAFLKSSLRMLLKSKAVKSLILPHGLLSIFSRQIILNRSFNIKKGIFSQDIQLYKLQLDFMLKICFIKEHFCTLKSMNQTTCEV